MGLRLREGISPARLAAMDAAVLDPQGLAELAGLGLIEQSPGRLAASDAGLPLLNAVLRRITA